MLPDLTSLIDKTPTQIFIIIGLVIGLTFIAYAYYMIFSIVFLFFFHYETKRAFFGENPRSSTIVSLFFIIFISIALIYGLFLVKPAELIYDWPSVMYYVFTSAVLITIVIQETGKKLFRNSVAYDSIISFAAILIFISQTPKIFNFNPYYGYLWGFSTLIAIPFISITIKKLPLLNLLTKILWSK